MLSTAASSGARVSLDRPGGDVVVSTKRFDRVLEHETGDLTCTVEGGVRLTALRRRLARHGQMLALDPPGDPTVGACIAADLFGPRRHRYGRIRDLLLGTTVVLSDGTIASSGGKVVKNVAGYDLGKLFCGSAGRLGLVVRASLRLHPVPAATRTLVVPVRSPDTALGTLREVLRSQLVPSAVDLLWPGKLCVLFEGSERSVAQQLDAARKLAGGDEGEPWDEVLAFQARAGGRRAFAGLDGPMLVRVGEAFVEAEIGSVWSPLAERVRVAFDPAGVLT